MIGLLTYAKIQPQNDTKTPFDMKKYNELSETSKKKINKIFWAVNIAASP